MSRLNRNPAFYAGSILLAVGLYLLAWIIDEEATKGMIHEYWVHHFEKDSNDQFGIG